MTIDAKTIQEWEQLAEDATEGPWGESAASPKSVVNPKGDAELGNWMVAKDVFWADNRAFIAASRTAVPELCVEVRRLQADNARMREAMKHMLGAIDGGSIDSEEVGGGRDVGPHKWHEEWAARARVVLVESET